LSTSVQASLAEGFAYLSSTGFSEPTLQQARMQHVTLEVFFGHPAEIHACFPTGRTTMMLFPITGPHADPPIMF